jgi:hypothetical protein
LNQIRKPLSLVFFLHFCSALFLDSNAKASPEDDEYALIAFF